MHQQLGHIRAIFLLTIILSAFSVLAVNARSQNQNPYTPKAFAIRYWNRAINNNLPKPPFILSKASPLSATEAAFFAKLAAANALSTRFPEFCSAAHLLCSIPSLATHSNDKNFAVYNNAENFTTYGTSRSGIDSFKNYSDGFFSSSIHEFRQYSHESAGHDDRFASYGENSNAAEQIFNAYGSAAVAGSGDFKIYDRGTNVPNLKFTAYSASTDGRKQTFTSYSEAGNAGNQSFTNYGKNSVNAVNDFNGYGTNGNVFVSDFSTYTEKGTDGNDSFASYGVKMNGPTNNFKNYAKGSFRATESFSNYREKASAGADSFSSYGKESRGGTHVDFNHYGKSFFEGLGTESFKGYVMDVSFRGYLDHNNTFKDYSNSSRSGILAKNWVQIQPGKFFRERMMKEGNVMPMPDIRDKLPQRSFLPRAILTKLPFSSLKINELKHVFKVSGNSYMDKMIANSLRECERAPSPSETKRCVGSLEDMIDFVTSVLGRNVTVRTTENINGSSKNVMVGRVNAINSGKVTESVSCHQSLFPYLLYYCHSVPKVRVFEVDLLDPNSKAIINRGVAICHLDTNAWSPTHGAFLTLGFGPGRIEVCHWIFENDMTWTIAD